MGALLAHQIKKQFFDDNGNPLNGGMLYIYEAGTTTSVITYTDAEASVENTNPIVLNTRGEVGSLYLNIGSYKFVLKDSEGNTIWTVDNFLVRDFGSEIDNLGVTVDLINGAIAANIETNRITSGESSENSSRARFLVPIGTAAQVKILATDTNLVYVIEDVEYTLEADTVETGLVSAPTSNNTALVNDSNLSAQDFTKTLGEFGSLLPVDTIGSEITSKNGEIAAFKIVGSATEYFIGRIDTTNLCLRDLKRGYFFNNSGAAIERTAISDNNIITLMRLSYVYLKSDGTVLISYTEPFYGATAPTSPSDGDMWYDTTEEKWKRFNSTSWDDTSSIFIGVCIQDESGNTVGARSADFYSDASELNTFECEYVDAANVRSKAISNIIDVNGNTIKFSDAPVVWDMSQHLESGEVEAASTDYYRYIKENGDRVISPHAPFDDRGNLSGFYHPYEAWRYVGKHSNDSSSDISPTSIADSCEKLSSVKNMLPLTKAIDHLCSRDDRCVLADATSGDREVFLYPSALNPGGTIIIKKIDSSSNKVTLTPFGSEEIDDFDSLALYGENDFFQLVSTGEGWCIVNKSEPAVIYAKDVKASGTAGGTATGGAWYERDLNTLSDESGAVTDSGSGASLKWASIASNRLTLLPGTYELEFFSRFFACNKCISRIYSITGSVTNDDRHGSTDYTISSGYGEGCSIGRASVTVTEETTFALEYRVQNTSSDTGLGTAGSLGPEVYSQIKIRKLK